MKKKEDKKIWKVKLSSAEERERHLEDGETFCEEIDNGVLCLVDERKTLPGERLPRRVFFVDYENKEVYHSYHFCDKYLVEATVEYVTSMDEENFRYPAGSHTPEIQFGELKYGTGKLLSLMESYLDEYPELEGVYRKFEKEYEYWRNVELFNEV